MELSLIRGTFQWTALVVVVGILGICCRWWAQRRAWNPRIPDRKRMKRYGEWMLL